MSFVKSYSKHFVLSTRDVSDKARQYGRGLMQAGARKNMDRMAEVVPDAKSRNLQQFLTHSSWDARAVIDHVADDVNDLLGDSKRTGLIIDESGFAKQGKMSVGTSRQWLGRLGKVDNGQVAVFGALASDRFVSPVDVRLFLPKDWTRDRKRCEKAGVPKDKRKFHTKIELARQIVEHARENGLNFGWVGADAGYGKGPGFCISLEQLSETFMIDVHSDFFVYMENPSPHIPTKKSKIGRPFKNYRTDKKSKGVGEIVSSIPQCDWKLMELRDTTRGRLKVRAWREPVYIWDGKSAEVYRWHLIATRSVGSNSDIKISITNAPESTPLKRMAWMQRQRFWVERTFEDAKSECGMADYQVRKWSAWHHHMALVMMSMVFMLSEKIKHKDAYPLLSCADIEDLLAHFLPRRDITKNEVIRQMEERHRQRTKAIISHSNRRRL
jgi:SRSO17 transposase